MSSILKRTILLNRRNGQVRPFGWASVVTTLGQMFEPNNGPGYQYPIDGGIEDVADDDEIARIDDIWEVDLREEDFALADDRLCGGIHHPRSGPIG